MGQVITFAELPASPIADGIDSASVMADAKEMAIELMRIAPGKRWTATVPAGSDCYLFMLGGAATVAAAGEEHRFPTQAFATVQEGVEFTVDNASTAPAEIVKVIAPPNPEGRTLAGFTGGLSVIERGNAPALEILNDKKTRLFFVDEQAAKSQRGHAMIVIYKKDTVTGMHMHPNAESMFVVLDGALEFTVNGAPQVVKPGQAAIFGTRDRHGLHTAEGHPGASFLEFHVPAAYTTEKG